MEFREATAMRLPIIDPDSDNATALAWLGGLGIGALLAYLFDPVSGRRRRSLVRDRAVHVGRLSKTVAKKTIADAEHRAYGFAASLKSRMHHEPVSDDLLSERVRARLGRIVSHPKAIDVRSTDGIVILSGPVLTREAARLLRRVRRVSGVRAIDDRLDRHETAENIPALQGGTPRIERAELLQENWAPTYRMLGGLAGAAMVGYGLRTRGLFGGLLLGIGGAVLARAITNLPFKRLTGIGAGTRAIDLEKHIHIDAPADEVFAFFRSLENFPRFMSHLRSVESRDGYWHWKALGPAGVPVTWDAEVTELRPNELIAWKSIPGSMVETSGMVRMEPETLGGTLVEVRMSYNPPGGAIGHAVASLFGVDPRHALNDDLLRLKSLLEAGKATAHGHSVTKQEVLSEQQLPLPAPDATGYPYGGTETSGFGRNET
jgi:uncharacterized membrane protein